MELSAAVKEYDPTQTGPARALAARSAASLSAVSEERQAQQMKALADARSVLKQLPDKQSSERQGKAEKARMLKERLKMLKQMIPFMSPAAAKSLKIELKQIASQLASLGAEGGGGIGDLSTPQAAAVTDTAQAVDPTASATEAADGDAGENTPENGTTPEKTTDGEPAPSDVSGRAADKEQDRQLQETLEELKRLFRTVRAMVQRKLQQAGDKGEPVPDLPPQLQAYVTLPEPGSNVTVKA